MSNKMAVPLQKTCDQVGYRPSWLRVQWESGKFPVPFKLEPNGKLMFWQDEIDTWLEQRAQRVTIETKKKIRPARKPAAVGATA